MIKLYVNVMIDRKRGLSTIDSVNSVKEWTMMRSPSTNRPMVKVRDLKKVS